MSQLYTFRHLLAKSMSKLIFVMSLFSFQLSSFHLAAQAVTKHGESTITNTNFINQHGVIKSVISLNKYGQIAATADAASSAPTLCVNTALTPITHATTGATGIGAATGLPAGVTAAYTTNTITISGTPTELGTFNYSIPLTTGCGPVNATGTITVTDCGSSGYATITTPAVRNITLDNGACGGEITSDGGTPVTARGVCWSTSTAPTVALSTKTTDGDGTGSFSSSITGLIPLTPYYVRAYATNSAGTAYGNEVCFRALAEEIGVASPTGRTWMNRNLGASQVATSSTDALSYGDLYQWGRYNDGHQIRTFGTTTTLSSIDIPVHPNFIIASNDPYDWCTSVTDNLWQGVSGENNPCPTGFRIPTSGELNAELALFSTQNAAGAFASVLKLPTAGARSYSDGSLTGLGSIGNYWTSTTGGPMDSPRATSGGPQRATGDGRPYYLDIENSNAYIGHNNAAYGYSIRCIMVEPITTNAISTITTTSAMGGGNITSDIGNNYEEITYGVCWSTNPAPTVADNITTDYGYAYGAFNFNSYLTGLSSNTIYYVRAYVTNTNTGVTNYGKEVCFRSGTEFTEVFSPTGRIWMDRNLGATQVATSSTDALSYGDLYQWGRTNDGHQLRTSGTTTTLSSSDTPGHSNFIITPISSFDWRSTQNAGLWQDVSGTTNNPCPVGFKIPTKTEINLERAMFTTQDAAGAFASVLKLPAAGFRNGGTASLDDVDLSGGYWSSTVGGANSYSLNFGGSSASLDLAHRSNGYSVRCIKENTINTTAVSDITTTTAIGGGEIISDGGAPITARGVCWSTNPTPTVTDNISTDGTDIGSFISAITGLSANTVYYVRAYATNGLGTMYGKEVSFRAQTEVVEITSATGRVWMDRNLGADQVATSPTDALSYGDLYQWGRTNDGHQIRTFGATPTLSSLDAPGHPDFIVAPNSPYDWRSTQNNGLWQGASGTTNNPCPAGFRIPTKTEINLERTMFTTPNATGAYNSALKLPAAGFRNGGTASLDDLGLAGGYWSSTVDGINSYTLNFGNASASINSAHRSNGYSVRCIKESTINTAAVSDITATTAIGGGEIISDGGAPITVSGICWSTTTTPTVALPTKTTDGATIGSFTSAITGLSANTIYYVRAYSTNSNGTAYGKEVSFRSQTEVVTITSSTGRIWMDRNLGADQVATSSIDAASFGDLYQWGRTNDGHQIRTSDITSTLSDINAPGHPDFIISPDPGYSADWRSPQNSILWQGISGVSNPCPAGFRIPTEVEFIEELETFTTTDAAGAFASALKLPTAGYRGFNNGLLTNVGNYGGYWSSTWKDGYSRKLSFENGYASISSDGHAAGLSVRCIKEYTIFTTAVSNITATTATSGGNIISDDGAPITASGVCWSTSTFPTADLTTKTTDGTTIGAFTSVITGLSANTIYYARAYATNSNGTAYGNEVCFRSQTEIVEVTSATGRIWMDRNLGADQVAASSTDALSYGDLYQWGRPNDGHQIRTSATSAVLSPTITPGHPRFIRGSDDDNSNSFNWLSYKEYGLWQGVSGVNNPCPSGFRLPTSEELGAESAVFTTPDAAGAFASVLKLPAAGARDQRDGSLGSVDDYGGYWSSTAHENGSYILNFVDGYASTGINYRSSGYSVRCIKEYTLSTTSVSDITTTAATSGGEIISDGGAPITASGICWSTSALPTVDLATKTTDGAATGSFTSAITGLSANTVYYVRAYATNSNGTAYGNEVSFRSQTEVVEVTSSTGRIWMDRNLGAVQAATSSTDALSYGDLYQWGRINDGHQIRTSGISSTFSDTDVPGHPNFIKAPNSPYDWRSSQNDGLWQGVSGVNNPCPTGFRIPTEVELDAERMIFTTPNAAGAFASALKFPAAGYRNYDNGLLVDVGSSGAYWSSRWDYLYSYRLFFNSGYIQEASDLRSFGFSVRCIKEYTLSTTAVSDITTTTATSGGEIISDGGAPITASGICWSTSALPTVDLATKTTDGAATGSFTSAITGLSANTVYYVRAYATNSNGTVYGKEICFKSGTEVVEVTSSSTGRIWMDRNLGADQAATSSTDDLSYGDLYQWGRINDGHQIRTSAISSTLSDTDTPGRPDFIKAPNSPYDWRSTQNDGLWQGVSGVNNPCPTGFRIPTETELVAESATFTTPDAAGAFASALKFPAAGARNNNGLVLSTVGSEGYYWTSAIVGTYSRFLYFNSSGAGMYNYWRAMGQSVRCIKE